MQLHALIGNHDAFYKNTNDINSMNEIMSMADLKSIKYYSSPDHIEIDGLKIALLPWICSGNYQESIDFIKNSDAQILLGHLELTGFEMHKGMISENGSNHEIFQKFDYVFTGHYHHRSTRDNIHYIGAFCEHIWSDFNDPRGFIVFDTESRDTVFHRNPFRIFHMVAYDDVKNPDILEKINATDYSNYKNCYVKVVCVNKTNPYSFDALLDKLYQAQAADISIVEDVSAFTDNSADDLVDEAQDTLSILSIYVDGLSLPVDNDRMKTYMREVYMEALTLESVE
jgi:DNA repair exonuclease SbcCD nuclease subunit